MLVYTYVFAWKFALLYRPSGPEHYDCLVIVVILLNSYTLRHYVRHYVRLHACWITQRRRGWRSGSPVSNNCILFHIADIGFV